MSVPIPKERRFLNKLSPPLASQLSTRSELYIGTLTGQQKELCHKIINQPISLSTHPAVSFSASELLNTLTAHFKHTMINEFTRNSTRIIGPYLVGGAEKAVLLAPEDYLHADIDSRYYGVAQGEAKSILNVIAAFIAEKFLLKNVTLASESIFRDYLNTHTTFPGGFYVALHQCQISFYEDNPEQPSPLTNIICSPKEIIPADNLHIDLLSYTVRYLNPEHFGDKERYLTVWKMLQERTVAVSQPHRLRRLLTRLTLLTTRGFDPYSDLAANQVALMQFQKEYPLNDKLNKLSNHIHQTIHDHFPNNPIGATIFFLNLLVRIEGISIDETRQAYGKILVENWLTSNPPPESVGFFLRMKSHSGQMNLLLTLVQGLCLYEWMHAPEGGNGYLFPFSKAPRLQIALKTIPPYLQFLTLSHPPYTLIISFLNEWRSLFINNANSSLKKELTELTRLLGCPTASKMITQPLEDIIRAFLTAGRQPHVRAIAKLPLLNKGLTATCHDFQCQLWILIAHDTVDPSKRLAIERHFFKKMANVCSNNHTNRQSLFQSIIKAFMRLLHIQNSAPLLSLKLVELSQLQNFEQQISSVLCTLIGYISQQNLELSLEIWNKEKSQLKIENALGLSRILIESLLASEDVMRVKKAFSLWLEAKQLALKAISVSLYKHFFISSVQLLRAVMTSYTEEAAKQKKSILEALQELFFAIEPLPNHPLYTSSNKYALLLLTYCLEESRLSLSFTLLNLLLPHYWSKQLEKQCLSLLRMKSKDSPQHEELFLFARLLLIKRLVATGRIRAFTEEFAYQFIDALATTEADEALSQAWSAMDHFPPSFYSRLCENGPPKLILFFYNLYQPIDSLLPKHNFYAPLIFRCSTSLNPSLFLLFQTEIIKPTASTLFSASERIQLYEKSLKTALGLYKSDPDLTLLFFAEEIWERYKKITNGASRRPHRNEFTRNSTSCETMIRLLLHVPSSDSICAAGKILMEHSLSNALPFALEIFEKTAHLAAPHLSNENFRLLSELFKQVCQPSFLQGRSQIFPKFLDALQQLLTHKDYLDREVYGVCLLEVFEGLVKCVQRQILSKELECKFYQCLMGITAYFAAQQQLQKMTYLRPFVTIFFRQEYALKYIREMAALLKQYQKKFLPTHIVPQEWDIKALFEKAEAHLNLFAVEAPAMGQSIIQTVCKAALHNSSTCSMASQQLLLHADRYDLFFSGEDPFPSGAIITRISLQKMVISSLCRDATMETLPSLLEAGNIIKKFIITALNKWREKNFNKSLELALQIVQEIHETHLQVLLKAGEPTKYSAFIDFWKMIACNPLLDKYRGLIFAAQESMIAKLPPIATHTIHYSLLLLNMYSYAQFSKFSKKTLLLHGAHVFSFFSDRLSVKDSLSSIEGLRFAISIQKNLINYKNILEPQVAPLLQTGQVEFYQCLQKSIDLFSEIFKRFLNEQISEKPQK
jgi:hypothetical protein